MSEAAASPPRWRISIPPGSSLEMGFVKVDRAGSTQDWESLAPEAVIARRAEYQKLVEAVAEGFDAIAPLGWQGDGVMVFVSAHGDPRAWSREAIGNAAMRAGVLALTLHEQVLKAGFNVRIGAHGGRVAFDPDTGKMASVEIDRAGHLEHDCPAGAATLSEDVYLNLPPDLREKCGYLGRTLRDGTIAYVCPKSAAGRRDRSRFLSPAEDLEPAQQRFLRYVESSDVNRLRYVGFRLARREPPSLDLLEVFTPLAVEEHLPERPMADRSELAKGPPAKAKESPETLRTPPWQRTERSSTPPHRFPDVFREQRHLVVLGPPGSGKSTLLRWLAVVATRGRVLCRERLDVDERLLPVLVAVGRLFELREAMSDQRGDVTPSLLDVAAVYFHERNAGEDVGVLRQLLLTRLEAGTCLVLLDGLDEVPTDRRTDIGRWIESFASAYRENRFIVTSRIVGFTGLDLPGGATVAVRPFDDDQIRAYLMAWHRAYRAWEANLSRANAEIDRPHAESDARQLADVILKDHRLHALAANPFLLSAMALVHRAEGKLRKQILLAARSCADSANLEVRYFETVGKSLVGLARTTGSSFIWRQVLDTIERLNGTRFGTWLADQMIKKVASRGVSDAWLALMLVERLPSENAVAALTRVLEQQKHARLRALAARGLAAVGSSAAISTLRTRALQDSDSSVRRVAVVGMARAEGRGAVDDLVVLLGRDPDETVRATCASALGNLEDERVFVGLLQALRTDSSRKVREAAAAALGRLGDRGRAIRQLEELLEEPNAVIRAVALGEFARIQSPPPVDRLIAVLTRDGDPDVRSVAAGALGAIGCEGCVDGLLEAWREEADQQVREAVAEALGAAGDRRAVGVLLAGIDEEPSNDVRSAVVEALGRLGDARAFHGLVAALEDRRQDFVRVIAAIALADLGDSRAIAPLAGVLSGSDDHHLQETAAEALGRLNHSDAFEPLINALQHGRRSSVRAAAARALGSLGDIRAIPALTEAIHGDPPKHPLLIVDRDIFVVEPVTGALWILSDQIPSPASMPTTGRQRSLIIKDRGEASGRKTPPPER